MAKTYGQDLRERVIAAVEAGASRRAAAERFKVGVSTAIVWVRAWFEEGRCAAKRNGGDTRSHRIETHRDAILAAIEAQQDVSLAELAALVERDHAARFAPSTVHGFLARHRITVKKRMARPVCKSELGWRVGLHQRIRSQGIKPGQDGFRASQAS